MALILCEIHGETGAALVSPDIKKVFINRMPNPSQAVHQVKVILFDQPTTFCWLSSEIVDRFDIPVNRILSEDEFSSYREIPLEPVCGQCFLKWLKNA
jgi:hypothetical protein